MDNIKEDITKEAEQLANKTEQLADQHYTTALRWNQANFWQGTVMAIATSILSIGTTSSIIVQYFVHTLVWSVLGFSLSLLVTILTSIVKLHKPGERGDKHVQAGHEYSCLSDQTRLFYKFTVTDENKTNQELIAELRDMVARKQELDEKSLPLPTWVQ